MYPFFFFLFFTKLLITLLTALNICDTHDIHNTYVCGFFPFSEFICVKDFSVMCIMCTLCCFIHSRIQIFGVKVPFWLSELNNCAWKSQVTQIRQIKHIFFVISRRIYHHRQVVIWGYQNLEKGAFHGPSLKHHGIALITRFIDCGLEKTIYSAHCDICQQHHKWNCVHHHCIRMEAGCWCVSGVEDANY